MADYIAGDTLQFDFQVVDINENAVTGLTASDFTITIWRRSTGDHALTTPTTTITERALGFYTCSYPLPSDANGYYYKTHVLEKDTITDGIEATHEHFDSVAVAPGTNTASNAYCSTDDVSSYSQMGMSGTSDPTTTEVTAFMVNRSAELYAVMYPVCGAETPGPATGDYSTTISTSDDKGLALNKLLVQASAIAAAADQLQAAGAGEEPRRSERVAELLLQFENLKVEVREMAQGYIGYASTVVTHISAGESTKWTPTSGHKEPGLGFTEDTKF